MKTEPQAYSIEDLRRDVREPWDGVRNFMARNHMRDDMKKGDLALFYHSSTEPPGVVGVAKISKEAHPDPSQFDPKSKYFDKSKPLPEPRWVMVEVEFVEAFDAIVSLDELKLDEKCEGMLVTQRGQRLSVQPVEPAHFKRVVSLGRRPHRSLPQEVAERLAKASRKKATK